MRYFDKCRTSEELKKAFHKAAVLLHPDNGGNEAEFKAMRAEYDQAFDRLKDVHMSAEGQMYTRATDEAAAEFADIIEKVIHFDGVVIEIIGSWVWLSGNTMIWREQIRAAGFWWSKSKKAWYYSGRNHNRHRKGRYSMQGLRERFGSVEVETEEQVKLA